MYLSLNLKMLITYK